MVSAVVERRQAPLSYVALAIDAVYAAKWYMSSVRSYLPRGFSWDNASSVVSGIRAEPFGEREAHYPFQRKLGSVGRRWSVRFTPEAGDVGTILTEYLPPKALTPERRAALLRHNHSGVCRTRAEVDEAGSYPLDGIFEVWKHRRDGAGGGVPSATASDKTPLINTSTVPDNNNGSSTRMRVAVSSGATAEEMQAALLWLYEAEQGRVSEGSSFLSVHVTAAASSRNWTVTFNGLLEDVEELRVAPSPLPGALIGDGASVGIRTIMNGSWSLGGEFRLAVYPGDRPSLDRYMPEEPMDTRPERWHWTEVIPPDHPLSNFFSTLWATLMLLRHVVLL